MMPKSESYRKWLFVFSAVVLAVLLGCGGKPFKYENQNEIPPGPGVFSGQDGEFTVYSEEAGVLGMKKTDTTAAPDAAGQPTGASKAPASPEPADEAAYRDFQEFQQWQLEKKEFEAFQQWKKTRQGSKEYEEFQEWKRWRDYRQWQEKQQPTN